MLRRAYTMPLLAGMLTLAACPSDDVPADTEGTSTGETTTSLTSFGPTTDIDPGATSIDPDAASGGAACEPACGFDECCVLGRCFPTPDPVCAGGCDALDTCRCPVGSDPCDCEGECVACGTPGGGYDPCFDVDCSPGSLCVLDDPAAPTFGWCALQGCGEDDCACPLPAAGATARPACGTFAGDARSGSCFLDCSAPDASCPEGMICRSIESRSACVWPGEGIESSCCFANNGPGCDDRECETAVCDADAYCCDTEWDDICVGEAQDLCGGLCPLEGDGQPQYGDCINLGPCAAGLTCLADGEGTMGWCSTVGCMDDGVCQPPPATGDAPAICGPIDVATDACVLDCSMGQTCPDGMTCFGGFSCVWEQAVPPRPELGPYGDCADNPASTCQPAEDACITEAGGSGAACSQSGCADASECPAAPATGTAPVACGDLGTGTTCYLDCAGGQTCPDGMVCTDMGGGASACLWADDGFVLDEDFEHGVLRPGWTVIDVDGNTPDAAVSFVTDAWVVADELEPGANFGAYSTSWYLPAGQSDDWLVTPQITLGPASTLSWEAWAPDVAFPDGYELRISTGMPTVVDFTANPPVFAIADEADAFTSHMVDLAAEGYASQDVYIAFRNDSFDEFVLVIDDVRVTE